MNPALREIVAVTLRMYLRNRMALAYSYVFPVMFLVAFIVLYSEEQPLLIQHMGELLTVTILGGACFGLPTSMVGEREHGVWRRYRLSPVPPVQVILGTLFARYLMILAAGVLQVAACMIIGGWSPGNPFQLWVAFTLVTFALLGLGLVLAAMADTVPAVQALGQCIFLPMLILGGVAVKLSAFEDVPWVLHLSAFFPGRYAVEIMQVCVQGDGLGASWYSAVAVILTGLGAGVTGAKLFRWDAHQRFAASRRRAWILATVGAWILIGIGAEVRREIAPKPARRALPGLAIPTPDPAPAAPMVAPEPAVVAPAPAPVVQTPPPPAPVVQTPPPAAPEPVSSAPPQSAPVAMPAPGATTGSPVAATAAPPGAPADAPWRRYNNVDFARLDINTVPPDNSNETPIAGPNDEPDQFLRESLDNFAKNLPDWPPGKVADPVQRVRNLMYIAGVMDQAKSIAERQMPYVIMERLRADFKDDRELTQILCWIANHPAEGSHDAIFQLDWFGVLLNIDERDVPEIRLRVHWYSIKFVWWLLGW